MRPEKQAILSEVEDALQKSQYVLMAEYRGLKVEQMTALRNQMRKTGSRVLVAKNTHLRLAAEKLGRKGMTDVVSGPTAIITGDGDVTAVAKALRNFVKENSLPLIKGGMLGSRVLTAADVEAMATIAPREVLLGQLVGTVAAPMSRLVGVMNQKLLSLAYVLKAIERKKNG